MIGFSEAMQFVGLVILGNMAYCIVKHALTIIWRVIVNTPYLMKKKFEKYMRILIERYSIKDS